MAPLESVTRLALQLLVAGCAVFLLILLCLVLWAMAIQPRRTRAVPGSIFSLHCLGIAIAPIYSSYIASAWSIARR